MERLRGTPNPMGADPRAGGTGSPTEAAVGALGVHAGDGSLKRPGPTSWGDGEACPGGCPSLWSVCKGQQPAPIS